jgi:CRP-like cAMP-binding protein/ribonuclease BN (tRNA processing enzyme)
VEVRILGCSGGKTPTGGLTSFLVDGRLLLDAGSVSSVLTVAEQEAIGHVLITHSHLDHICGLPFLYDNTRDQRQQPLHIWGPETVITTLKQHFFIPEIQPGVRSGQDQELTGLAFHEINLRQPFAVDGYEVEAVKVNHPAGGVGYFISDGAHLFVNTGDTGRTDDIWKMLRERKWDILITEVSFPNPLQKVAELSCHLSPHDLAGELEKAEVGSRPVYLSHLKPAHDAALRQELAALSDRKLIVLEPGDVLRPARARTPRALSPRQQEVEEWVGDKVPAFDLSQDLHEQREALEREFAVNFKAGEVVCQQGEPGRVMYIIREGRITISRTILGVEKILLVLGPGEFFGEMAIINKRTRSANATAQTDAKLLAFSPKAFEKLVKGNWGVALKMIRTLAYRLQEADIQIENLMFRDTESRLVNTLIRAADDEGINTPKGRLVRLTPEELSQRTGLQVVRLKEVLSHLVRTHLIHIQKDAVLIPNLGKLDRLLKFLELRQEFTMGSEPDL